MSILIVSTAFTSVGMHELY